MVRYETIFLTVPEFTNDEFSTLESQVHKLLQESKCALVSYERWGKYRLAYPIRKNDYGVYGLIRFEVNEENKAAVLNALKTLLTIKYGDSIMRTMTVSLDPHKSLAYHRPESLEEVPVRDVDTFLKENKMDSLIGKKPRIQADEVVEETDEEVEEGQDSEVELAPDRVVTAATPPAEGN